VVLDWFTILLGYLVIINLLTFILFWFDKWMARSNSWRIRERTLWLLMFIGGSVGALLGMNLFRHKTKKVSFLFVAVSIFLIQTIIILAMLQQLGIITVL
jgi:uncharacterized membrane protein YsdA (DUF1294 family)